MNIFDQNIDLNLYKTFCAVAETKSFSKAAEMLYVTQPAISHNVQTLENLLNTKLFHRGAKGVTLTSEAENLLVYIKMAYNYIYMGEQNLKNSKELLQGEVRIGIPTHLASILLIDKLKEFNQKYPNVKLDVQSKSTKNLVLMLENHELDIIIDSYPIAKESMHLNVNKMLALDTALVAGKELYNKYNNKIDSKTINKVPLILPNTQTATRKKLDEYFANKKIKLNPMIEISSTEITLKMVKENMGIRLGYRKFYTK